jgi:hypothetical protein
VYARSFCYKPGRITDTAVHSICGGPHVHQLLTAHIIITLRGQHVLLRGLPPSLIRTWSHRESGILATTLASAHTTFSTLYSGGTGNRSPSCYSEHTNHRPDPTAIMVQSTNSPTPDSPTSPKAEVSPTSRPLHSPSAGSAIPSSDAPAVQRPASPLHINLNSLQIQDAIRRPSIQFRAHSVMTGEPKTKRNSSKRRMSSPPPPP